jgi:hypothetical protein
MRLLVFLQHLDELLNSVRASIGFLGGLNSEEDGSFLCLEYTRGLAGSFLTGAPLMA